MDIGLRRYFTYGFRRENSKDSFGVCVRPKGAYSGGRGRRRIGGVGASGRFRIFREPACGGVFVQYHRVVLVGFGGGIAAAHTSRYSQYGFSWLLRRAFDFREFFARFGRVACFRQIFRLCGKFVGEFCTLCAYGFCREVFGFSVEGTPRFFARTPQGGCPRRKKTAS